MNRVNKWKAGRLRKAWERDGGRCHYCREETPAGERTVDHVVPRSLGGPNNSWNVVAACRRCNGGFGATAIKCRCDWCEAARLLSYEHALGIQVV